MDGERYVIMEEKSMISLRQYEDQTGDEGLQSQRQPCLKDESRKGTKLLDTGRVSENAVGLRNSNLVCVRHERWEVENISDCSLHLAHTSRYSEVFVSVKTIVGWLFHVSAPACASLFNIDSHRWVVSSPYLI